MRQRQYSGGGNVVQALEACWAEIGRHHLELPTAVLIIGHGSHRFGYFAASRWRTMGEEELCEVLIAGEGLVRGGVAVFGTLLHEAAHAIAHERKVNDTSRQGRYHNQRFKLLAEELGLCVAEHPSRGWTDTILPEHTARRYIVSIARLEQTLDVYRTDAANTARQRSGSLLCMCHCGRRIRIAPTVLSSGPVICGVCGQLFKPKS